jgi:hypothetical protein
MTLINTIEQSGEAITADTAGAIKRMFATFGATLPAPRAVMQAIMKPLGGASARICQ